MALLRSELEIKVLTAAKSIKQLQIEEANEQIEILKKTRQVVEERAKYYEEIEYLNSLEKTALALNTISLVAYIAGEVLQLTKAGVSAIPQLESGMVGPFPITELEYGGKQGSEIIEGLTNALLLGSNLLDKLAIGASNMASNKRRWEDWKLQERLAKKELASIDKQITAAEIRKEIADKELKNHELQIDNAKKVEEFMRSKFTNQELYDWMIGQISSVYFTSYQLAHDFAKKAERSYRFELGNDDTFISYGYWDSMKKGLQTADHLIHDIKRMEASYLDKNKREYEITKHISLAQLDPLALIRLRTTGVCDFDIPEVIYDMDYPGQYFRRLKSVSISLPCVAGPYTSVSAKLSLINNRYRKNINPDNSASTGYIEDPGNDERFVYNIGTIQSVATSNAQNDSGVFELNFRDERYLPFENTGAISSWRLELPTELRQFNYNTISDLILHVKYMAREGGSVLKNAANDNMKTQLEAIKQDLSETGLHMAINMKHDLSNEWQLLKKNGSIDLSIDKTRLPYMVQAFASTEIENVLFLAKVSGNPTIFTININGVAIDLEREEELNLCKKTNTSIDLDTSFTLSISSADQLILEELILIVKYKF